ncbi:uncharacterized protein LOC133819906 [Humulus lupulus]|uniref:uncharacterized protein LOC133819906 n=1 Tax=Humulus lupulus TaxID=3486 RepID=UPI002B413595|nr:uncharacterized protein LOC133819906 [Humulus lupulus]
MGDQNLEEKANDHDHHNYQKILIITKSTTVRVSFRIITQTLLSLLLPLAFLNLAKIVFSRFLLSQLALITPTSSSQYPNYSPVFDLHTPNLAILYLIVSTISLATLLRTLTYDKLTTSLITTTALGHYVAWIFLLTMQVSIGLGLGNNDLLLDSTITNSDYLISSVLIRTDRTLYSKAIFFLGLHESTIHWSKLVVEPVVNDASFGVVWRKEDMVKRVMMSIGFWCLWCYLGLREEVEGLVFVAEAKWKLFDMDLGMADFVGWWLYYMTVMIGVVKVVKGLVWVAMSLFYYCLRVTINNNGVGMSSSSSSDEAEPFFLDIDDKV